MEKITWKNETRKLSELKEWDKNARLITDNKFEQLVKQIKDKGFTAPFIINADNTIIAGHQRRKALLSLGDPDVEVPVRVPSRKLSSKEFEELAIGDNLFQGAFDTKKLTEIFDSSALMGFGFERWEIGSSKLDILSNSRNENTDPGTSNDDEGPDYENTPNQNQFDDEGSKGTNNNTTAALNEEEKMMPFEVLLKVPTRREMHDTLAWIKKYYQVESHDAAIRILLDIFNKHKTEGINE